MMMEAAESHDLLSWNQMGTKKKWSILSAVDLLSSCVKMAWKTWHGCIVLMLSLDLVGAFDNVSHERLLHILYRKRFPEWLVGFVKSFLTERHTRIRFTGHESK